MAGGFSFTIGPSYLQALDQWGQKLERDRQNKKDAEVLDALERGVDLEGKPLFPTTDASAPTSPIDNVARYASGQNFDLNGALKESLRTIMYAKKLGMSKEGSEQLGTLLGTILGNQHQMVTKQFERLSQDPNYQVGPLDQQRGTPVMQLNGMAVYKREPVDFGLLFGGSRETVTPFPDVPVAPESYTPMSPADAAKTVWGQTRVEQYGGKPEDVAAVMTKIAEQYGPLKAFEALGVLSQYQRNMGQLSPEQFQNLTKTLGEPSKVIYGSKGWRAEWQREAGGGTPGDVPEAQTKEYDTLDITRRKVEEQILKLDEDITKEEMRGDHEIAGRYRQQRADAVRYYHDLTKRMSDALGRPIYSRFQSTPTVSKEEWIASEVEDPKKKNAYLLDFQRKKNEARSRGIDLTWEEYLNTLWDIQLRQFLQSSSTPTQGQ